MRRLGRFGEGRAILHYTAAAPLTPRGALRPVETQGHVRTAVSKGEFHRFPPTRVGVHPILPSVLSINLYNYIVLYITHQEGRWDEGVLLGCGWGGCGGLGVADG